MAATTSMTPEEEEELREAFAKIGKNTAAPVGGDPHLLMLLFHLFPLLVQTWTTMVSSAKKSSTSCSRPPT